MPDPVQTKVETGVVPEPVNVATPTTTHETAAEPTRDATADRADTTSAEDTPATRGAADTPEPVRTTADDNRVPTTRVQLGLELRLGQRVRLRKRRERPQRFGQQWLRQQCSDGNGSDAGGPGGARTSAAVSIHP